MKQGIRVRERLRDMLGDEMHDKPVAIRLPAELLERIDRVLEKMRRENPALSLSRADAIRVLLTKAVEADEKAPKKPGK